MYYFYIFLCNDGSLYSGSSKDLKRREQKHNSGKGSKYIRSRGGGKIIYYEKLATQSVALKREIEVKRWTRARKLRLIGNNFII